MRRINPETGKPFPRKYPIDIKIAFAVFNHRREHLRILEEGFFECQSFGCLPFEEGPEHLRITDVRVHPDGTWLYVKTQIVDKQDWFNSNQRVSRFSAQQKTVEKTDWLESNLGRHLDGEAE